MMNIFTEPAVPFLLFNYSDFVLLLALNIVFYIAYKIRKIKINLYHKIAIAILFVFVLPMISTHIELNNVHKEFEIVDSFNVFYVLFKIPIWWIIGLLNIFILKRKFSEK